VDESSTKLLVKCPLEEQNEFLNSVQSVQKMPVDIEILEKLELNKRYYLKTEFNEEIQGTFARIYINTPYQNKNIRGATLIFENYIFLGRNTKRDNCKLSICNNVITEIHDLTQVLRKLLPSLQLDNILIILDFL
jgi:hypothetical protein